MESEKEILAGVRAQNGHLTGEQLGRWSTAHLIGPKQQRHRPGVSGSETYYPPGTLDRVLAIGQICNWRKKRFGWIGWQLWWNGYPADERYWKVPLTSCASWFDATILKIAKLFFVGRGSELSDCGFESIDKLRRARTRESLFSKFRRRINPNSWSTSLRFMLQIATGRFRELANYDHAELQLDRSILDSTLGIGRARTDSLEGAQPWLTGEIDHPLITLSRNLKSAKLAELLQATDDRQLEQARDEIRGIFEIIFSTSEPLEFVFGRHAFGFRVLTQIAKHASPRLQALFILMWPLLKKSPGTQEKINELLSKLPEARRLRAAYQVLIERARGDRVLAGILTPRRIKAAMLDNSDRQLLVAELQNYYRGRAK